ncbi:MAG: hypothetical protein DCO96_14400 [Fluviicola sp. XM-24bin1]|nr:MAG: hypothetical protein DCO96_14400 [Fluviicola sp. XM-24bin1]
MKDYSQLNAYELNFYRSKKSLFNDLLLFQSLLRSSEELNLRYHGNAKEIADGLQPWIDALQISIQEV